MGRVKKPATGNTSPTCPTSLRYSGKTGISRVAGFSFNSSSTPQPSADQGERSSRMALGVQLASSETFAVLARYPPSAR